MTFPRALARHMPAVNRMTLHLAGHVAFADLEHAGRKTGIVRHTPVRAFRAGDTVLIGLNFGRQSDWYQNIAAAGTCRIRLGGACFTLGAPVLVPAEQAVREIPWLFGIALRHVVHATECVRLPILHADVSRSVPPAALVKMGNPLVRMVLGSPLHGVLDDSFLVLHLTGRKTGRRYQIPVGYVDMDGRLAVVTIARWRVNLRGGAEVEVMLRGRLRPMHALLEEDPASVAVSYQAMIGHLGWKKAQRQLGISLPGGRAPTVLELRDAAHAYGWSVITLTPR
jgi:deazaflavin-dependent oxidoreductase (nitroreductase family)